MKGLTILTVYLAGVGTSFTPCVYPLLPIIISFIGAQSGTSYKKRVILTLIYILGTAFVYSLLGVIASLTGSIFGLTQNSFLTNFIVGIICLIFSLSMFGLFSINLQLSRLISPSFFKGYAGAFILGATSGTVFSPCTTPVLGTVLSIVATKQDIIFGSVLLFIFALGLSTTLFLAGVITGFLTNLPRSGKWMVVIEKIFATVLLFIGLCYVFKAVKLII